MKDTLNFDKYSSEFARGVLAGGWKPKELGSEESPACIARTRNQPYEVQQQIRKEMGDAAWIDETPESAAISCFCGVIATAFLSTSRAFEAGKLAATAVADGQDPHAAVPCDN